MYLFQFTLSFLPAALLIPQSCMTAAYISSNFTMAAKATYFVIILIKLVREHKKMMIRISTTRAIVD